MTTVVWRFVSRPEAASPVLLDMNQATGGNKIMLNFGRGFDISPPELKQSFTVNSLVDGGRLTSTAYENRVLKFSISLQGTLIEKTTNLALLKRELGKYRNLIMYTPKSGTIPPVFFRTFKSDSYVMVNRTEKGAWHVDCEVIAEPFALGVRVKPLTNTVVSNDPLNASNGQRVNFPTIIGDVPTPAFASIVFDPALPIGETFYLASRSHDNAEFVHHRQFKTADLWPGGNAFMWSGGNTSGGEAAATNFAGGNTSLQTRATFNSWGEGTDLQSQRGRYRLLIRVHTSVATSTFGVQLQDQRYLSSVKSKFLTWVADDFSRWDHLDMGVFTHPVSEVPMELGYSGEVPTFQGMNFTLDASRISGTGNFEFDYVAFLPADEHMLILSPQQDIYSLTIDGPNGMIYSMQGVLTDPFNTSDPFPLQVGEDGMMPWRGSIPDLVPGAPNTWYMLNTRGETGDVFTLNVYYWPKWLEVAAP